MNTVHVNKMDKNNTKNKIQQTALSLFSIKGYSSVSIRDIGKIVGIKESTIYYHFKNKQDIFDALLREVQEITARKAQLFNERFKEMTVLEKPAFIMVGINLLEGYLLDSNIHPFICMLMIEQHVNEDAAMLYQEILFEAPLKQNAEVFQKMIDNGCFKEEDAKYLAIQYYGIISFIFQRYFSNQRIKVENVELAKSELKIHLEKFYDRYRNTR